MTANAMHVAKSGLNAQQIRMQVIANNLSNVNTTGFKKDRANFESLLYQVRRYAGDLTSRKYQAEFVIRNRNWCKDYQYRKNAFAGQSHDDR